MTTREDLSDLQAQIKAKEAAYNALERAHWESYSPLKELENELIRRVVLEESLLNLCTWSLEVHSGTVYLTAKEDSRDVKALSELTETTYHCDFVLEEGINLHYSDGDMTLHFEDPHKIYDFITRHKIPVNLANIDQEIEKLQSAVDSLWDVRKHIK